MKMRNPIKLPGPATGPQGPSRSSQVGDAGERPGAAGQNAERCRRRARAMPPCRGRPGRSGAGTGQGSGGERGPGGGGGSPLPAEAAPAPAPAAAAAAGRRGCGRPAWEGLSGGPSPGADGAAAAAAIRRRGSRCPAWEGPCCIAAAALLPLRAHNGDSQPQQRLRRRRRERAGRGRPAGARRRQQHAG